MLSSEITDLDREIRKLKAQAEEVYRLSKGFPAAERNAYMILRHLGMLEMEICDVVSALHEDGEVPKET